MTEIYFANYFQSKNHKKRYKKEKLMCKAFGKCRTKGRALGIEVALSNCTGEMGMDNFDSLNSSSFISVLWQTCKKNSGYTKVHSHSLPHTPIYFHLLPFNPTHSQLFAAHCHLFPLFLTSSHSFSAQSYPLPLMFIPLLFNLSPLPSMYSLSHPFPVHIQTVHIIYSQMYFFHLELP